MRTVQQTSIINAFHDLYYNGLTGDDPIFKHTYWLGVPTAKCPLDLWIYQEILVEQKPDLVIETGTFKGGSALYLANILDLIGKGKIVTIDIEEIAGRPTHPRLTYVTGSSADARVIQQATGGRPPENCLVILDSDHSKNHVAAELKLLAPLIPVGGYLIVEDSNINGHPTYPTFGPGPYEAVEEFLKNDSRFVVDETREKFLMTFNPRGFLKRVA